MNVCVCLCVCVGVCVSVGVCVLVCEVYRADLYTVPGLGGHCGSGPRLSVCRCVHACVHDCPKENKENSTCTRYGPLAPSQAPTVGLDAIE